MEIRRLVKSGAASHTVALPIEWIRKNKLEKGALLHITEKDNALVISTQMEAKREQREITIPLEQKDIGTVRRETIAAYINNYSMFTFVGDVAGRLSELRKVLDNFLALEIVEQTSQKLVAKDFLNLQEFSLATTVRRMDMLTRSMLDEARRGPLATESLELTDYEVDKLFFLVSRLFRSHLNDSAPHRLESFSSWWLAKNLENVADVAKQIAPHMTKDVVKPFESARRYYVNCSTAFFKNDKGMADALMAQRAELVEEFDAVTSNARELLKQIVNTSRTVAKIVMDS